MRNSAEQTLKDCSYRGGLEFRVWGVGSATVGDINTAFPILRKMP